MTEAQRTALTKLCERYNVEFDEGHYYRQFDLPEGYLCGWIGDRITTIFVGVSPEGEIHS